MHLLVDGIEQRHTIYRNEWNENMEEMVIDTKLQNECKLIIIYWNDDTNSKYVGLIE